MVHYCEYSPPAQLSGWVECAWSGVPETPTLARPVLPDGCIDIVYSRKQGLVAVGAMTVEQRYDQTPGDFHCGVRFLPGMAREFLKIPSEELTDKTIMLDAIAGPLARELTMRLDNADTAEECARIIAGHVPVPCHAPRPIQRAITAIAQMDGRVDLDRVAGEANLSMRHFRRLCLAESGLTPKHLCRVLRFRSVLRLPAAERMDWAGIAAEAGYFDQSHLIRDFREFTGQTPMAVFSNRLTGLFA